MPNTYQADVVIAGGGLAGLATAHELLERGLRVLVLDRDTPERLGGLDKRSFGGVMFVDTPHQRKLGIHDSPELAWSDWLSFADFGDGDDWPRRWARTYVERSTELVFDWLTGLGVEFLPLVNWAERGLFRPGNSVPRWHIAWGTGHAIVEAVVAALENHRHRDRLELRFDHRVERLLVEAGRVVGCAGATEDGGAEFEARAEHVVLASGGICGGDLAKVRANWYQPWGRPPRTLLNGSHRFADGLLHDEAASHGAALTHLDKQWHYAAGVHQRNGETPMEGISLVPPRSALWLDATGRRFGPVPLMGYTDTRWVVEQICRTPAQYSWQVLNWKIAIKELAVSGCDYMTAFRHKRKLELVKHLVFGNRELVDRLVTECSDFLVADTLDELMEKMEAMSLHGAVLDREGMAADIAAYDAQIARGARYFNDDQLRRIAASRTYRADRLRTCAFQAIDDPKARPLIAIREFILSRKSLGGLQTDLASRVFATAGEPIPGLYAVGETAGFGGGGIHGKGSLEGTFLGSCVLTGRLAARAIAGGSCL
ncbi:MAG TPA: FAD-binding dehydrogenase [Candidatus Sulfomarinibacteraceae bacterium]|nr:FAD-binding dehydrogenase [Candidatus Sulfomarinibacteraceae bacterium]